jgi:hypothetical protein
MVCRDGACVEERADDKAVEQPRRASPTNVRPLVVGGVVFPQDDSGKLEAGEGGPTIAGEVEYYFSRNASLMIGLHFAASSYSTRSLNLTQLNVVSFDNRMWLYSVEVPVTAQLGLPVGRIEPRLGAGLGLLVLDLRALGYTPQFPVPGSHYISAATAALALHWLAGFDVTVSQRVRLGAEYLGAYANTDFQELGIRDASVRTHAVVLRVTLH